MLYDDIYSLNIIDQQRLEQDINYYNKINTLKLLYDTEREFNRTDTPLQQRNGIGCLKIYLREKGCHISTFEYPKTKRVLQRNSQGTL